MKPATNDVRNEALRGALMAIAERNEGVLNPLAVVEAARDPDSPLHPHFTWDDDEAAEAYRVAQAGALIRRVKLTIIKTDTTSGKAVSITTTRSFQSRPSMRGDGKGYEPLQAILSDEDKRAEMLDTVLRELSAYRRRYKELAELSDVWAAIDDARDLFISERKGRDDEDRATA